MDPTFSSSLVTTSPAYLEYQKFIEIFGHEEFILVAIKNDWGAADPRLLRALESITNELEKVDKIAEVVSVTNLRFPQKRGDRIGNYPVIQNHDGALVLPTPSEMNRMRTAFPSMDLLLAPNLKTVGVLIRVDERWRLDTRANQQILSGIAAVLKANCPATSEYRIIGPALIREAILSSTVQTSVIYGLLCTLICTVVTVYVFKSIKVTGVTILVLGLCVYWVLGLMALLGIPLNAFTSTAFGLIMIATLEIVIHMVVRFNQFQEFARDRLEAARETVSYLARPCLISATTTAVGFGTGMVSSLPSVFQFALIMSLGTMVSFCIAMILTPSIIIAMKSLNPHVSERVPADFVERMIERIGGSIAKHYRLYTLAGFVIAALMFTGTPLIRTDPQWLRLLGESAAEIRDIRFVETNLTHVHSLELLLESRDRSFKRPEMWEKVQMLEARLSEIPDVVVADTFLPFLQYALDLVEGESSTREDLFTNPNLIAQLLFVASLNPEGKRLVGVYLDDDFDRLRISIRIRNSPSISIVQTIENVRSAANSVMKDSARVAVTGEIAMVAAQSHELIKSQIESMLLAFVIITFLMMIQMGTPLFGLISLVPNIPPLAAVWGIMGWFGIPLHGITVFAAAVAVGLAVDNTIHYVAQLKREMKLNPALGVEQCVFRAYNLAAKPMASWSFVTLLGFLALAATPFRGATDFGILVSCAILMGMFGDLLLMQSLILSSAWVRKIVSSGMENKAGASGR